MQDRGIKVRLAIDEEGQAVGDFARHCGFDPATPLDWSNVYPYWIIAEREGEWLGLVNMAHSRPIGRLEIMCLDPDLSPPDKGITVRQLFLAGRILLRQSGSTVAASMVGFDLKSFKKACKKRGGVVVDTGNMIFFPLGKEKEQ